MCVTQMSLGSVSSRVGGCGRNGRARSVGATRFLLTAHDRALPLRGAHGGLCHAGAPALNRPGLDGETPTTLEFSIGGPTR